MRKLIVITLTSLLCSPLFAQVKQSCLKYHFFAEGEYLCWWLKSSPEPVPLVLEGSFGVELSAGLGLPGTKVVLGDKDVNLGTRSGARFTVGGWFNSTIGLEANYLFLPKKSKTYSASSSGQLGSPYLILPFIDATTGEESSNLIADPGQFSGWASEDIQNEMMGAEGDILGRIYCSKIIDLSVLSGFRWWNFDEKLTFQTESLSITSPLEIVQTKDTFHVRNNFYGGQVGIDARFSWKCVTLQTLAKVALGGMNSNVTINGNLSTNEFNGFGDLQTFPGGYFAQPTNEGKTSHTKFALLPEFDLNLGFQIVKWASLQIGYTFLYATNALWAGNTIDREINPSQAPAISMDPSIAVVGAGSC